MPLIVKSALRNGDFSFHSRVTTIPDLPSPRPNVPSGPFWIRWRFSIVWWAYLDE